MKNTQKCMGPQLRFRITYVYYIQLRSVPIKVLPGIAMYEVFFSTFFFKFLNGLFTLEEGQWTALNVGRNTADRHRRVDDN